MIAENVAGVGIDIGGTNIKYVAALPDGTTLVSGVLPTSDAPEAAAYWVKCVRTLLADLRQELGITLYPGVASPGLPAADGSSIHWMRGRMESVQGLNWTQALEAMHSVPVLNDAHAALMGEVWCGAALGSKNAIMYTLGTGVGGACLVDGRLLRGHLSRAGHLGHVSLNADADLDIVNTPGSLEDAIGECTLASRTSGRFSSTRAMLEAVAEGDADAEAVWQISVKALAAAVISAVNVLDPETVIIGGGIAAAGDALYVPLKRWMEAFEWRPTGTTVKVTAARLGEFSGASGAACAALEAVGIIRPGT